MSAPNAAAAWSVVSTTNPSGTFTELNDVSCPSTETCMAVGYYDPSGTKLAFANHGLTWTNEFPPAPAGAASSELLGVSCPSTTLCYASGRYSSSGANVVLVERWESGGVGWHLVTVPLPTGTTSSELGGISCASTTSCFAAGNYHNSTGIHPLIERLSSTTWSFETPSAPIENFPGLGDVYCVSGPECMAVGTYRNGSSEVTFADAFSSGWTAVAQAVPTPGSARFMNGVSCESASIGGCVSVGSYNNGSQVVTQAQLGLSNSWSLMTTTNPGTGFNSFNGVSCYLGVKGCIAVGRQETAGTSSALIEKLTSSWATVTAPTVSGLGSHLVNVSCANNGVGTECWAVGSKVNAGGETQQLVEKGTP